MREMSQLCTYGPNMDGIGMITVSVNVPIGSMTTMVIGLYVNSSSEGYRRVWYVYMSASDYNRLIQYKHTITTT